jgi:predicted O-linked N-acetylglucosamine transferase (SPINDLY family)
MLADAERRYAAILQARPDHFDALHLLGILRQQQGNSGEAARLIGAALKLNPRSIEALCNFGAVLNSLDLYAEALAAYDQALAVEPDHIEALCKRGSVLLALSRFDDALAAFDRALAVKPDLYAALSYRGNVLVRLDRLEEALVAFDQALAMKADHVEALISRGNTLMLLDRPDEALPTFDKVIELRPDHAMALGNRALSLVELGRYEDALESFGRALQIAPDDVSRRDGYGTTQMLLGRHADALATFDKALVLAADRPEVLRHRAEALRKLRRHDEAVAVYDRLLAIDPDDIDALYHRGKSLWTLGRLTDAMASHERASALGDLRALGELVLSHLAIADWAGADKLADRLRAAVDAGHFVHSFAAIALECHPADQLRVVGNLTRGVAAAVRKPFVHSNVKHADKLRIAYLSSDYWHHPVGVAIADLLERHDRTRFEIIGVSYGPDDHSALRARLIKACDRFHDACSDNDRNVAALLHDSDAHIAVDLNGLTEGFRPGVLACRPAPIQVNYLGYPGTTGAEYMDYIIADETVLPFDQQAYIAEKIVHLPDCYHVNDATRPISSYVAPRSDLGPPDQGMVFCCFNQTFKIAAPIFDIWMRLLARVPGSVLWLSEMHELAQANLRREAAARGVDPERLIFAPRMDSSADHLARHRAADLFLDTLPYNAHSTTCDALFAGLPVVTCTGATFPGRVATSMLRNTGLPELVTSNLEEYEALGFKLATDRALLQSIRRKLADNRPTCRLFDSDRFRRHIEAAYETMWDIYRRGESPKSFRVEPRD